MKRIALIALAAAAALVSCRKEVLTEDIQTGGHPVFTASIAADETKTTLSGDSPAKILWESTDRITITDTKYNKAVYKLSAGEGTKSGTFVYESGLTLDASSTYTATYGVAPINYQAYSDAGSVPLYMTASASSTNDLVFTARCGVLRVTLTDASHDIMRVEVSDASGNTYRVTSSSPVDITSETKFYIVLPEGTYTSLNIYDDDWQIASKTDIWLAITAGHMKPAVSSSLSFTDCTTKGFKKINSVVRAIVQLWTDGPFWSENNIGAGTPWAYGQYFAWGYTTGYTHKASGWTDGSNTRVFDNISSGFPDYKTHTYSDMAAANWGAGWSVPTDAQLRTLINTDGSNKCSASDYVTMEATGIIITGKETGYTSNSIFLPAAGHGTESKRLYTEDEGCYWSSVHYDDRSAYDLEFFRGRYSPFIGNIYKYFGGTVRPVYTPEPAFSVSATKKVKFTKGNLYWDGSAYHLETIQTAYPTSWDTSHVGHFFWSETESVAYAETYSDSGAYTDTFFFGEGNPLTVDGQEGLYAMNEAEWAYLFQTRNNASNLYRYGVTVGTAANCLVIAPDGYSKSIASSYDGAAWAAAESAGLVCLPAAGYRSGSSLYHDGSDGDYWSATPDGKDVTYARYLYFDGNYASPLSGGYRGSGHSVRLVSPAPR